MVQSKKTAVALGSFDGLHRGHMAVIASALKYSEQGLVPIVLLFDVHPQSIISGAAPTELIQSEKRSRILSDIGIGSAVIPFADIHSLKPEDFFRKIILGKLNAGAVCCGWNYRFGEGGEGTSETLKKLCESSGVELSVSGSVDFEGKAISSTRIRCEIENGNITKANAMLGRPFSYKYTVVSGDRRGRLIGAPTINQHFAPGFTIPRFGVYASATTVDGKGYISVTNIGRRPSFTDEDLRSETCILDFSADIYGRDIEVMLLDYLRPERKFDSLAALSRQINADSVEARRIFADREVDRYV